MSHNFIETYFKSVFIQCFQWGNCADF